MAQSTKKPDPAEPKAAAQTTAVAPSPSEAHEVDAVAVASRRKDGTPDQTPDFVFIDPEFAAEATEAQLVTQRVSAVDQVERASAEPVDPEKLKEKHEAAAESARKDAEAEVKAHS